MRSQPDQGGAGRGLRLLRDACRVRRGAGVPAGAEPPPAGWAQPTTSISGRSYALRARWHLPMAARAGDAQLRADLGLLDPVRGVLVLPRSLRMPPAEVVLVVPVRSSLGRRPTDGLGRIMRGPAWPDSCGAQPRPPRTRVGGNPVASEDIVPAPPFPQLPGARCQAPKSPVARSPALPLPGSAPSCRSPRPPDPPSPGCGLPPAVQSSSRAVETHSCDRMAPAGTGMSWPSDPWGGGENGVPAGLASRPRRLSVSGCRLAPRDHYSAGLRTFHVERLAIEPLTSHSGGGACRYSPGPAVKVRTRCPVATGRGPVPGLVPR